jgi:hypothetical protein
MIHIYIDCTRDSNSWSWNVQFKRRETFWSACIFIRTHPLPHTILPQMYVESSPMALFGNDGYISISYSTPLSAHGYSNSTSKNASHVSDGCPHEWMCGPLSRTALLPVWWAGSLLWAWNQGSSICGRIKWEAAVRIYAWNCTPNRPLSLLSVSAVVVGAITVVKMQMRTLTLTYIKILRLRKHHFIYIPDGRKRLAFQ